MDSTQFLKHFQWLATDRGTQALREVREWSLEGIELTSQVKRARQKFGTEVAPIILEQVSLQERAQHKFPFAEKLLWTRQGLEQSTSWPLSLYKASCMDSTHAIDDFCCGVGGDLLGMATRYPVCGWERDPLVAWIAQHNLQVAGGVDAEVRCEDCPPLKPTGRPFHCDPDRRGDGKRTVQGDRFSPTVSSLLDYRESQSAAIKLACATRDAIPNESEVEREWLGEGRECKQQLVWLGPWARHPGKRTASVVWSKAKEATNDRSQSQFMVEQEIGFEKLVESDHRDDIENRSADLQEYLVEPHAAVIAAELTSSLALEHNCQPIAAGHVLLHADSSFDSKLASCFRVLDQSRLKRKDVEGMLQRHEVGELELKLRGIPTNDPWQRFKWKQKGGLRRTLFITRRSGSYLAVLTERIV